MKLALNVNRINTIAQPKQGFVPDLYSLLRGRPAKSDILPAESTTRMAFTFLESLSAMNKSPVGLKASARTEPRTVFVAFRPSSPSPSDCNIRIPMCIVKQHVNPLNTELNLICYLLALLGAHHFLHVSRIRVKSLTLRLLMSYTYGAPILDVSRSCNDAPQLVGLLWTTDQLFAETST